MPPHVTVLVPVKDRRERMLRCLAGLLAQDYPDYDVLILDNGSSDGTREACLQAARGSDVPVAVESIYGRVGHVRNVGGRLATGGIIAYTDSDCVPAPGWLSAGVAGFDDPEVGVVTGTTLPEDPPPHGPWPATLEVTGQTWRFESCNVSFRREAFCQTGGFDEHLGHFWEDTVAGWEMLRAGWKARFVPDAVVYHDVTYPGLAWHLRRLQKYGKVAAVVGRFPEARERLLWRRYFLRPRNASMEAAVSGIILAAFSRKALLLTLPYLYQRGPRTLAPAAVRGSAERMLVDASVCIGMIRGSIRWRSLVL